METKAQAQDVYKQQDYGSVQCRSISNVSAMNREYIRNGRAQHVGIAVNHLVKVGRRFSRLLLCQCIQVHTHSNTYIDIYKHKRTTTSRIPFPPSSCLKLNHLPHPFRLTASRNHRLPLTFLSLSPILLFFLSLSLSPSMRLQTFNPICVISAAL